MDIKEATIHQLSKAVQTRGDDSVTRHIRTSLLLVDNTLRSISKDLLAMYATRSNSTGTFNPDCYRGDLRDRHGMASKYYTIHRRWGSSSRDRPATSAEITI